MSKTPSPTLTMRIEPALRRELDRAAQADARPVSALVRKILREWLASRRQERKV
jgi:hypothetical protein